MISHLKRGLVSLTLGLLVLGCQAGGVQTQPFHAMARDAARCDKCQVIWVKAPDDSGQGRVVGYPSRKGMECPDCKDAVSNFFATGNLKHDCKACGGKLAICEVH